MKLFKIKVETIDGEKTTLEKYKGKVLLIVNTASECDNTKQLGELQKLYEKLGNEKFEILAFPSNQFANQEPKSNEEIKEFYEKEYGVTYPLFSKIRVNGVEAHPIYKELIKAKSGLNGARIEWNFVKFIVDASGRILARYYPNKTPAELEEILVPLIEEV